MREANAESLEAVYIYTHTIYLQNVENEGENKESLKSKNKGFISGVKKLYIKYRKLKINVVRS